MIKLEVVIPCYNEEKNLEPLWWKCLEVVKESKEEIAFIIVDNGSSDKSWELM